MKKTTSAVLLFGALAMFAAGCSKDKAADTTAAAAETTVAAAADTTAAAAETTAAAAETTAAAAAETTAAAAAAETTAAAAAAGEGGKAGFILPDSKSSDRWEGFDRPLIDAACKAAGITCEIQNAEGDAAKMATIADQMITGGAKVLALVNLDSPSAVAIQEKAAAAGVKLIDYDRLTLKGKADVYVSFDNVGVGTAQGEGLIKCFEASGGAKGKKIIQLHGAPTDNNATLFKQGYQAAIKDSGIVTVGEEAVPGWDNVKGGVIFEQLLTKAGGKIDGVLAANDGLSGAAQTVLTKNGLTVPTTGQDATVDGLRAILSGTQCMTVYKPVKAEADAAVKAAAILLKGGDLKADFPATINNESADIAFTALAIQPIFLDSVKIVTGDKFVPRDAVCKDLEDKCKAAGV